MIEFPQDRLAKRQMLLDGVARIAETLRASGPKSEELGTLAPEAVNALRDAGMFRLKLAADMGGAEADPVTEMLVLEGLAYNDLASGWCTMVGATGIASLGTFLPQAGLERVFTNGQIPTAAITFFPAGRAVREGDGFRINGRWRFNSGIRHAEWVVGGTVVEGTEAENGGRPIVMFSAFPQKDVTLYDNWGGVVGLRGTGSSDCSVENYYLPKEMTFVWDCCSRSRCAAAPSYLFPPFSLCRQGARQRGDRRGAPRARRADQIRHDHARPVSLVQARRAANRAPLHRRGRPEIAGGAGAAAPALRQLYEIAGAGKDSGRRRHRRCARRRGLRHRHRDRDRDDGVSLRRQYRPASSARHRPLAARPQHRGAASGDERHRLRKSRQIPPRPAGRSAGVTAGTTHGCDRSGNRATAR
jgi:hypothetical protein